MSFVSHIECTVCDRRHEAGRVLTVCEGCGQMLAVRYDLPRVAAAVDKGALRTRPPGMYRFRELTPREVKDLQKAARGDRPKRDAKKESREQDEE